MSDTILDLELLVVEAYRYAVSCHFGQLDKAGKDYMGHVSRVASNFTDPTLRIIAYLHDTLKDTDADPEYISRVFGEKVFCAVLSLTQGADEDYFDYIIRLSQNQRAAKVKIADLKDNMNLSRLPIIKNSDVARLRKYKTALDFLEQMV